MFFVDQNDIRRLELLHTTQHHRRWRVKKSCAIGNQDVGKFLTVMVSHYHRRKWLNRGRDLNFDKACILQCLNLLIRFTQDLLPQRVYKSLSAARREFTDNRQHAIKVKILLLHHLKQDTLDFDNFKQISKTCTWISILPEHLRPNHRTNTELRSQWS